MKKKYVTPEMEVIEMSTFGFLAASPGKEEDGWAEEGLAPGMMSFDDMDEDYMDEDTSEADS